MLLNNQNIRKVGENPIVLRWITMKSPSPHSPSSFPSKSSNNDHEEITGSMANSSIQPDASDAPDIQISNNLKKSDMINEKNIEKPMSDMSDMSDRKEEEESITNDDDDEVKLLNISGNRKGQPIEMSTEQYDSWMGERNEKEKNQEYETKEDEIINDDGYNRSHNSKF